MAWKYNIKLAQEFERKMAYTRRSYLMERKPMMLECHDYFGRAETIIFTVRGMRTEHELQLDEARAVEELMQRIGGRIRRKALDAPAQLRAAEHAEHGDHS